MKNKLNEKFLEKINKIYSKKQLEIIEKWFKKSKPSVFRINKLKNGFDVLNEFSKHGYKLEKILFLDDAYKIIKKWNIKLSSMVSFKQWYIYLQWISSQIPVEIIDFPKNSKNLKVLDLTSAPWWKSTQISWKMKNIWEIYACENNSIRMEKLKYTIKNLWALNIKTIKLDSNKLNKVFQEWYFDIILADLPCSAEGRINLNSEKSYKYLEKPNINKINYKKQKEILKSNISLLKTWWQIIYSTCTLDPLENEWVVHFLLSNFKGLEVQNISSFFEQKWLKNISMTWIKKYDKYIFKNEIQNSIRILPWIYNEWFFIVKLIKKLG